MVYLTLYGDLTWNHLVEYSPKINQRLALLKRIMYLLPFEAHMLFYNVYIVCAAETLDVLK